MAIFCLPTFFQGNKCILRAVLDYCARGTLQHLPVSAADLRGVLPAVGLGCALWSAQPNHHNHDRRGYCWCHDAMGHRLQCSGPYQSGHGKNMMFHRQFTRHEEYYTECEDIFCDSRGSFLKSDKNNPDDVLMYCKLVVWSSKRCGYSPESSLLKKRGYLFVLWKM